MLSHINDLIFSKLASSLIDPEKRYESNLWAQIKGRSYDFSTDYKKTYYDKLVSNDEKLKARITILNMLSSDKYSINNKTLIAYVCADLRIKEASDTINDLRIKTTDSLKFAFTLAYEAILRDVSVRELEKAVVDKAISECSVTI